VKPVLFRGVEEGWKSGLERLKKELPQQDRERHELIGHGKVASVGATVEERPFRVT